jgi:hypothetical protein
MSTSGTKTATLEAQIASLQRELDELQRRESIARRNVALFGKLDFKAWNNRDWDLFRKLHTEDVRVVLGSMVTDSLDSHVETMQAMLAATDSKIASHDIVFGSGEWTCCVATALDSTSTGRVLQSSVCTIARWRDGRIAEEYLFIAPSI